MDDLKELADLPEAQQKALWLILKLDKPAFRTSELAKKMGGEVSGQSAGAVLGALYRNGYLEKKIGGRDKTWVLSDEAKSAESELRRHVSEAKTYWSG